MATTGDPSTLAPEICIEVLGESTTLEAMEEKRAIYRDAGAEEVWIVVERLLVSWFLGAGFVCRIVRDVEGGFDRKRRA